MLLIICTKFDHLPCIFSKMVGFEPPTNSTKKKKNILLDCFWELFPGFQPIIPFDDCRWTAFLKLLRGHLGVPRSPSVFRDREGNNFLHRWGSLISRLFQVGGNSNIFAKFSPPKNWGRFTIWLIFFKWVGSTTNQVCWELEFKSGCGCFLFLEFFVLL